MPHEKNSKTLVNPRNGEIILARHAKTFNLRDPTLASRTIDGLDHILHNEMITFHHFSMAPVEKSFSKENQGYSLPQMAAR